MKKIVHIITRLDRGGSAQNTLLTCQRLAGRYELVLVHGLSLESNMTDWEKQSVDSQIKDAEARGVKIVPLASLVRRIDPVRDIRAFLSLWRLIRKERPFIVHTHSSKAGILGRWAAWLAGIPIVVHTPHGHVFWGYGNRFMTVIFTFMEKLAAFITDKIIVLTEQEGEDHVRFGIASREKFLPIHSGVDVNKFLDMSVSKVEMKRSLGIPDDVFVVGTVGRLTAVKGQRYLIEAARKIVDIEPHAVFVILGDGELLGELQEMASRLGIKENMRFLGWRSDVAEVMSTFDIFALPSLNEGMGRVLAEAMAAGKPLVASNVGGIPDLVKHGQNGFLVGPGDADGLSGAIRKLLTDKEMRDEMGGRGRAMAHDFSVEKMVEKIDALYSSLLGEMAAHEGRMRQVLAK